MSSHEISARRDLRRIAWALVAIGHPFATMMIAGVGAAFYCVATKNLKLSAAPLVLFGSIFLVLYSIGSMNDYLDQAVDAQAGRHEKPLVAGELSRATALSLWIMTAIAGLLCSLWFGPLAFAVAAFMWSAGAVYNFWAKPTLASWVPYAVFFPSLPVWAFVASGRIMPALLLCYPIGALLALGLNIANTLPDLESDAKSGLKGLAHRLGRRRSFAVMCASFAAAIAVAGLSPLLVPSNLRPLRIGLALAAILLAAMTLDWLSARTPAVVRRTWYASAIFAAVLGGAWVASLP